MVDIYIGQAINSINQLFGLVDDRIDDVATDAAFDLNDLLIALEESVVGHQKKTV